MAAMTKYTDSAVSNHLKHNSREFTDAEGHPKNPDIYEELTFKNYSLHPSDRIETKPGMTEAQKCKAYYRERMQEIYHMKRADLVCAAEWCVTCPKEIVERGNQQEIDDFFKASYEFLNSKYGEKNCIQCVVHFDEGIRDENGNRILGSPHMHYVLIPTAKVTDKNPQHTQSQYEEKVCAKELLTKNHLNRFHKEFQEYLDKEGIDGRVYKGGITGGKNRTVEELKQIPIEITREIEQLRAENKDLSIKIRDALSREKALKTEFETEREKNIFLQEKILEMEAKQKSVEQTQEWGAQENWGASWEKKEGEYTW